MRSLVAVFALSLLLGCGDPMATIPRLSDADVPQDGTMLGMTPDAPAESVGAGGFFSRFFEGLQRPAGDDPGSGSVDTAGAGAGLPPESYGVSAILEPSDTVTGNGQALPYGRIARICDLPQRSLGRKISRHPERGSRYALHDSDPGNTAPHRFYVTGFDDGCARGFTASVALFGSVEMHEQLRYGLPAEVQPYSDTDKAYEKIKSRICGVPRGKPCGSKRALLENDTVFLSIYETFGGNERWSNLLLHRGRILAHDIKG